MATIGALHIHRQVQRFGEVLVKFLRVLKSEEVRNHKIWGYALPFDIPPYGVGDSLGHCIRPDIVIRPDGKIQVCELDFVPSGRGFLLSALTDEDDQATYLGAFRAWYESMGAERILYGVASKTVCREEISYFCASLSELGVHIKAANLDVDELAHADLVDRLSYRSEMAPRDPRRFNLEGVRVITAEPYLDSKAVFAFAHDEDATPMLRSHMSDEEIIFLREVLAETRLIRHPVTGELIRSKYLLPAIDNPKDWVIKNSDVESDYSWGSRGVVIGRKYSRRRFVDALFGYEPRNKELGRHPILQSFAESRDFAKIWNAIVAGHQVMVDGSIFGHRVLTPKRASKKVYARVGVYYLVDAKNNRVFIPPYAIVTMRQDCLAHGTPDAVFTAARLV